MNGWTLRAAQSADLPQLTVLLPSWELESATFVDGDPDDVLLLAFADDGASPQGCVRIRHRIGLSKPRYWFHVGYRVHAAPDLGMFRRERTLLLGNDHTGATELSQIAVDPALSREEQGQLQVLLVRSALTLIRHDRRCGADRPDALPRIIAALPGVRAADGSAPFWQGLGRHFYPEDPQRAWQRYGEDWLTHVAALLPRHPLVVSVLHADAQAAIGQVDPRHQDLALSLAGEAGFHPGQHVQLHDGGPVYEVPADQHGARLMPIDVRQGIVSGGRPLLLLDAVSRMLWYTTGQLTGNQATLSASLPLLEQADWWLSA